MRKEIENNGSEKVEIDTDNDKYLLYFKEEDEWIYYNKYDTYGGVNKAIDRKCAEKKRKIKPLPAIKQFSYNSEAYDKVNITSLVKQKYSDDFKAWLSYVDKKKREKTYMHYLFKDTPENISILDAIKEHKKEVLALRSKLTKYSDKELKTHFLPEESK